MYENIDIFKLFSQIQYVNDPFVKWYTELKYFKWTHIQIWAPDQGSKKT